MIILAGGMSRRMGTDKADLQYQGKTFLEIQIEKGRDLGIRDILVSGYKGSKCSAKVVPDRLHQKGPLGGLEACLREAAYENCLVVSVDMPLVPKSELKNLFAYSQKQKANITILKSGEKEQPLLGVYHKAMADEMCREIEQAKGSVFALLNRTGYCVYESSENIEYFQNINDRNMYLSLEDGTLCFSDDQVAKPANCVI